MNLRQLLPSVSALSHTEKLQLMQWLAEQVTKEEGIPVVLPAIEYPIWSPYDSFEAAAVLSAFLEQERASQN
jgi:hypothetical protein